MKRAENVIKTILYTEKGTRLGEEQNKYLFKVGTDATKAEIQNAVESVFKVHVTKVNTMNRNGKRKRSRTAGYGTTARWKRAVVTLRENETIDLV